MPCRIRLPRRECLPQQLVAIYRNLVLVLPIALNQRSVLNVLGGVHHPGEARGEVGVVALDRYGLQELGESPLANAFPFGSADYPSHLVQFLYVNLRGRRLRVSPLGLVARRVVRPLCTHLVVPAHPFSTAVFPLEHRIKSSVYADVSLTVQ